MIVFTIYQSAVNISGYIYAKIIPLLFLSKPKFQLTMI